MNDRGAVFIVASALAIGCASKPRPGAAPVALPPPALPASAPQAFATSKASYAFTDADRKKKLAAAFPPIDELAAKLQRERSIPGLAIGVVVDGELVHARGFGFADLASKSGVEATTGFRIGSVTKSFTALSILVLRDEGKLGLDDSLTRFMPEAAGLVYPTRDSKPITIRQLLNHTSGLPRHPIVVPGRSELEPSADEIAGWLRRGELEHAPGTTFSYSNLGYALLGIVVARVSGMAYEEFVAKRIFEPLKMTSTGFTPDAIPKGRLATGYVDGPVIQKDHELRGFASSGGIYSTVEDLARYLAFQSDAYPPRDGIEGPIVRSTVRECHRMTLPNDLRVTARPEGKVGEPIVDVVASSYGFAWTTWHRCDLTAVWHHGIADGFGSVIGFVPDSGVGFVALANYPHVDLADLFDDALTALKASGGLEPRKAFFEPDPAFDPAVKRLLAVESAWDENGYRAMVSPNRDGATTTASAEQKELAGYRAIHGACRGYRTIEMTSRLRGNLLFECERGRLEMRVTLDPGNHLVVGFSGTSKGVPVPTALAPAAATITKLVEGWDHRLFSKAIAPNSKRPERELEAFFARVRAQHRGCRIGAADRNALGEHTIQLICREGGDLTLAIKVDEKAPDVIESYSITPASRPGICPVR